MFVFNAKSRYELPKVLFVWRIFKHRQSEIHSLQHSITIPSRILFCGRVSQYYNLTCLYFDSRVLVSNSKLSCALAMFSFPRQAPSATFLIKAFCVPRSQPEFFSLFLWYLHEFGTLEFYMSDLDSFVNVLLILTQDPGESLCYCLSAVPINTGRVGSSLPEMSIWNISPQRKK